MSYQSAKRKPLSDKRGIFSGGFVDNVENVDLSPYYSPYLRNWRLDGQSVVIRPGHQLFATLTAGDYPRGIGAYYRANSVNDRLIVRHNKDADEKLVSIETDGTVTNINTSTDITSDNRMIFSNIGDVIYCMNGVDDFGKLSGTTYTTPSTGIANFAPSFAVVFNGSHRASGWSANPNKVYKSVADNYEDFNSAGSDTFTFQETITGLAVNNETLFYFTRGSISLTGYNDVIDSGGTITFVTRPLEAKEGAINHAGIVATGNRVYFVTPSNKIAYIVRGQSIDGFEVYELSERKYAGISKLMSTLDPDQTECFGYFLPKDNIIKWFFKSYGAAFNDVCIVYDITHDAFLVDGQKYFYGGTYFKGKNYTISMIEEKVYQDEYSYDDEGAAIPAEYHTKIFYDGDPTIKQLLRESRTLVDINELASLTQEIRVNGDIIDTKTIDKNNIDVYSSGLGTVMVGTEAIGAGELDDDYNETYILRTKGNLNVKGRTMQWRFRNSVVGSKVRLKSIIIKSEALSPIANQLTV